MKSLSALKFSLFIFLASVLFFAYLLSISNRAYASSVIFEDNFYDGSADEWTPISGGDLWQVKEIGGNKMYGARIESSSKIIDTVGPSLGTSNYQIDFDYLPITNGSTSTVDRNLDFRWVPDESLGGWKLYEVHFLGENQGWTNFGYPNFTSPVPLANNQINHIKVTFQNQLMQFFLNGTQIIDYLDMLYSFTGTDKIGLRISTGGAYPTEVWFDNVVVTSLDEPTPTPTPTPESGAIPANHCAACVSAVLVMPQTCVTTSGVQSRTKALRASKPLVWAAMKAWSTQPSHNMMCSMPLNSITSVPGRIGRYRSATSALSVRRGSATMSFRFGLAWRASSMRRNSTGCA